MHNNNYRLSLQCRQFLKSWALKIGNRLKSGQYCRSISQSRIDFSQSQREEEEEKKKNEVWQNWVLSILKESQAAKNKSEGVGGSFTGTGGGSTANAFLKRAPANEVERLELGRRYSAESKLRRKAMNNMTQPPYTPQDRKMVWIDCEMSGLDPFKDKLLEIGMVITDGDLNVIAKHDSIVFQTDEKVLDGMIAWCQKHHGGSGLIDACKKSTVTHEAADDMLLKFLQDHTTPKECPMAGNSIGQDQGFIRTQLPKVYSHLHYRVIDVSTIKELTRRWYPEQFATAPKKKFSHRVLDDIQDSINELKYYRSAIFIPPSQETKNENGSNCTSEEPMQKRAKE